MLLHTVFVHMLRTVSSLTRSRHSRMILSWSIFTPDPRISSLRRLYMFLTKAHTRSIGLYCGLYGML